METFMETLKIKIEIADRRFEADGPLSSVEGLANAFMKLVMGGNAETLAAETAAAAAKAAAAAAETASAARAAEAEAVEQQRQAKIIPLGRIMRVNGTLLWLSHPTKKPKDALLVLLLGQRELRNVHSVTGTDLMRGLRSSGFRIDRGDYFLNHLAKLKYVTTEGKYRARRYQLTEAGTQLAQQLARQVIASI
jgi:hypothetical protein